jgi:hypothetical protein
LNSSSRAFAFKDIDLWEVVALGKAILMAVLLALALCGCGGAGDGVYDLVAYGAEGNPLSSGKAFLISPDGIAVTCFRNISKTGASRLSAIDGNGKERDASHLMAYSDTVDLAIVKVDVKNAVYFEIGEMDFSVDSIGYPVTLEGTEARVADSVIEYGVDRIIVDLAGEIPKTGAPVFNDSGEVVGVAQESGENGLYAIPASYIEQLLGMDLNMSISSFLDGYGYEMVESKHSTKLRAFSYVSEKFSDGAWQFSKSSDSYAAGGRDFYIFDYGGYVELGHGGYEPKFLKLGEKVSGYDYYFGRAMDGLASAGYGALYSAFADAVILAEYDGESWNRASDANQMVIFSDNVLYEDNSGGATSDFQFYPLDKLVFAKQWGVGEDGKNLVTEAFCFDNTTGLCWKVAFSGDGTWKLTESVSFEDTGRLSLAEAEPGVSLEVRDSLTNSVYKRFSDGTMSFSSGGCGAVSDIEGNVEAYGIPSNSDSPGLFLKRGNGDAEFRLDGSLDLVGSLSFKEGIMSLSTDKSMASSSEKLNLIGVYEGLDLKAVSFDPSINGGVMTIGTYSSDGSGFQGNATLLGVFKTPFNAVLKDSLVYSIRLRKDA